MAEGYKSVADFFRISDQGLNPSYNDWASDWCGPSLQFGSFAAWQQIVRASGGPTQASHKPNAASLANQTVSYPSGSSVVSSSSKTAMATGSGASTSGSGAGSTSPFKINITWDASVKSAPSGFTAGVDAAVQWLESRIVNPVAINIDVGYGEIDGTALGSGELGQSQWSLTSVGYSQLVHALSSDATSADDASAVASLPATSPISGTLWATSAQTKALGLASATGAGVDGYVGFSSKYSFTYDDTNGVASGTYDFTAIVLHEITEVMGRDLLTGQTIGGTAHSYSLYDLFHYSAQGVRDFSASTPGYFSVDGGTTDLAAFNTKSGGDAGDWASSVLHDSLDAFLSPSVINTFSAADLTAMDAIGWNLAENLGNSGSAVCFAAGTRILTAIGERPVETLTRGDIVVCLIDGRLTTQPVKWVGHRHIYVRAQARPEFVAPVCIQRCAFADNVPHSDLWLSPDHAVFVAGKLISARQLINGATISQDLHCDSVDYHHVELEQHAILFAEGLPAESYLDTGNRGFFANSGIPLVLHPDLTHRGDYPAREAGSCAPFVWDETNVRPIWQTLADRAALIGQPVPQRATTTDHALRLVAGGSSLKPIYRNHALAIFLLPRSAAEVRLVSRAQSPTKARPWLEDRRKLGVQIARIVLKTADETREVPVDHPSLRNGWWAVERDRTALYRWTNGEAVMPLPATNGEALLEVHFGIAMTYLCDERHAA